MNLIDEHMIRQFRRVPETGTTLEEPLTGWRIERVGNEHMRNLIELLVVPLTDLTDPQEMHGCAWGMAVALAQQATREAA